MTDDHDLTDDELLTVPGENIPPGRLTEFLRGAPPSPIIARWTS